MLLDTDHVNVLKYPEHPRFASLTTQLNTSVIVEVERDTVQTPPSLYQVTDPDEVADLRDALNDQNNPSYSSAEALAYLRDLQQKRG